MKNLTTAQYVANKYNEYVVREEMTLMDFLNVQMHGISRNRLKDILKGHGVNVDRKLVTQYDYQLRPGMVVSVSKHRRSTELSSKWIKIIYEDKDIIIIEKNEGILSMAATAKQFCVKTILDEYFQKRHFKCHAHVVHRLDRDTSGLMIYAKSIEAAQILERDWKNRVFDRRYIAVVSGKMEREGGTIENWLKDNKACVTYSSPTDNGGKLAVTHYRVDMTADDISLVELRLETGRKNQIRVHMADIGHPVLGDTKYGNGRDPLHRLCLHAYRLFLYHPMTGVRMEFETPYPTSFVNLFNN
ncbi:MAG: RluA family pseudouridine synthase [Bacteroidaceae bacterium]|nr:RluA family pseudouridine synthase [Bacteroidaceae bacterium]